MVLWQSTLQYSETLKKLNNTSQEILAEKDRRENGIPVNDNTMVELANLCEYLKLDFASYFKGYELPKDSKFFSGNY